jgi:hypothetical protein
MVNIKDHIINSLGRLNSRALNREYFEKINMTDLWDTFINSTIDLDHLPMGARFSLYDRNILISPKCHCGNKVSWLDKKISKYCSKKCAYSCPDRSDKISRRMKSQKEAYSLKREITMKEKYGASFNSQREDIHDIWTKTKLKGTIHLLLSDKEWLDNEYNIKRRTAVDISDEIKCYYGTVIDYCKKHGFEIRRTSHYSLCERQISEYVRSLGVSVVENDWSILKDYEIDISIPSKNLAIEIDGLWWHSIGKGEETKKNIEAHLWKTRQCEERGIQLIHVTDNEWKNKRPIVESILRAKLGMCERIYARKCEIKEVTSKESISFLNDNHIQGYAASKINLGLYYSGNLMMLMTFGSSRYNKRYDWELVRMSSILNVTVVGGMSKLLSSFRSTHTGNIISYCDRRYSNGHSYEMDFVPLKETPMGYFWTDGNIIISRHKSQKSNLKKWLLSYDPSKSESDNMFSAGFKRFWNCGNLVYEINGL